MLKYFIGWSIGLVNLAVAIHLDLKRHGTKLRNKTFRGQPQNADLPDHLRAFALKSNNWLSEEDIRMIYSAAEQIEYLEDSVDGWRFTAAKLTEAVQRDLNK